MLVSVRIWRCALVDCFNPHQECYRLVLLNTWDGRVLADVTGAAPRLPQLSIARWSRPAKQIQAEIERCWGFKAFILDIVEDPPGQPNIILAELLVQPSYGWVPRQVEWAEPEVLLKRNNLSGDDRVLLASILDARDKSSPFSHIGWIHRALVWFRRQVSLNDHEVYDVEQWNAGSRALLLRLSEQRKTSYWLKAVDPGQSLEYRITLALASLFPNRLPRVISSNGMWGAWLMEHAGESAADLLHMDAAAIGAMSRCFAELQSASLTHIQALFDCGCADWRLQRVRDSIFSALPLLEEAMAAQDVHGLPQFGRRRIKNLCDMTEATCSLLDAIGIPDTLIHNDLQLDNIIAGAAGWQFIDWDQAGIGNPLLSFQLLRVQIPGTGEESLVSGYRSAWAEILRRETVDVALALIPPIAVAVQLCRCVASIPPGTIPRSLELRHLRSLTRQLDAALLPIRQLKRWSA